MWAGDGFGLFYLDGRRGIIFQALEADGKPLGPPVVVEPDPFIVWLAADRMDDGFLLAWVVESDPSTPLSWSPCATEGPDDRIRIRRVRSDGATSGPPIELESRAQGPVDVAVGTSSVGFLLTVNGDPATMETRGNCAVRFARLDWDLASETYSGVLAPQDWGQVRWVDDHFVTAFASVDWALPTPRATSLCVSRFDADGRLERAPICTLNPDLRDNGMQPPRIAGGDRGLILLAGWEDGSVEPNAFRLQYLRTDALGVAIRPVRDVVAPGSWPLGSYAVVWSDDGFGVAWYGVGSEGLFFRAFVAE